MYFSNHNKNITYINHYSDILEVEGTGVLCREDTDVFPDTGNFTKYDALSITDGITGVNAGFLETFKNMTCLMLARSVEKIEMTAELSALFKKNEVLIRGAFDTYAERFARENGLEFLHSDIFLATDIDEKHYERTEITLRFFCDGKADIRYNVFTTGISAGSYGGGEYTKELPKDFYKGCTVESFAENFPERLRKTLLGNEELRSFLETANKRESV